MSLYNYLYNIEKNDIFKYISISIVIFVIVIKFLNITPTIFIAIILAGTVFYYLNDKNKSTLDNFNRETEYKLSLIKPKPVMFHMDSNIIDIFYQIIDYKRYNESAYNNTVSAVDNLLKIQDSMSNGVMHCKENFDIAQDMYKNALNYFNSFIISLPSNKVYDNNFSKTRDKLHLLLRQHLDEMYMICKKKEKEEPITTNSSFVINHGPKPDDTRSIYNPGVLNPNYNYNFFYYP